MFCGALLVASGGLYAQASASRPATTRPEPNAEWPKAEWLDPNTTNLPHGVSYETFFSNIVNQKISYLLYLPPEYQQQPTRRFPVIYWLHGRRQDQASGAAALVGRLDAMIEEGTAPPVIVVFVNGMRTSGYLDWENGQMPMESVIIKNLIPHIDQTWRTIPRREGRVIEGFSMGGYGASHLGFKYPELFGTVIVSAGSFGGPFDVIFGNNKERWLAESPASLARKNADKLRNKTHIRIEIGSKDPMLPGSQKLHEQLLQLNLDNEYEVIPDVDHNIGKIHHDVSPKYFQFLKQSLASLKGGQATR